MHILDRHDYPEPVAGLLAEAIVLTVLLGTSLKFEGKFILQTQTDGPVDMLVVDFRTPDAVRAYARFDAERSDGRGAGGKATPEALLGKGILAMTVDQGAHMQRYQGIVELDGPSLEEVARTYFRQSEQIPTEVRLAVAELIAGATTAAGPSDLARRRHARAVPARSAGAHAPAGPARRRRARGRRTADVHERTIPGSRRRCWSTPSPPIRTHRSAVGAERLLFRLFHEHGVRVFDGAPVADNCSCSRGARCVHARRLLGRGDRREHRGRRIASTCEFCSTDYTFDPRGISRQVTRARAAVQLSVRACIGQVEREGRDVDVELARRARRSS